MVSVSRFEVVNGNSNVLCRLVVVCRNFDRLVHCTFCEAFTFGRAFVLLSAVALSSVVYVACVRLSRVFV